MKMAALICVLMILCLGSAGCGETISGVGKDVNRMGRGVSTFFFRQ